MADELAPDDRPLLSVRGSATLRIPPELAEFAVTVRARDRDRATTLRRLNERNDEVLRLVRDYGEAVDSVRTASLRVGGELREGRGERVRAYHGTLTSTVRMRDASVVGELLGRLGAGDMVDLAGPWWSLRVNSPAYARVRRAAARAAVARARDYAEAVGGTLAELVEMADVDMSTMGGAQQPMRRTMRAAAAAPGGAFGGAESAEPPSFDLEPEEQQVSATVEARFRMVPPDLSAVPDPEGD